MTVAQRIRTSRIDAGARLARLRKESTRLAGRLPGGGSVMVETGRRGAASLMWRWPVALAVVRNQVTRTWRLLVAMPDPAIRSLAVGLAGLTTGLYVGGAPRILRVGSLGPTLLVGALALFRRDQEVARAT